MRDRHSDRAHAQGSVRERPRRIDEASRIADLLRLAISSGRYGDRGLIPSEPELMLEYAVSRNVVRECLDLLRHEGLIRRVQGSGTFARVAKAQHQFDHVHTVRDSVAGTRSITGSVLTRKLVVAPRPVANTLAIRSGEHCVLIEYTVVSDGTPFSVTTSYLPQPVAERLRLAEYRGDLYELLERAGFAVRGGAVTVDAMPANPRTASILRIGVGEPVMMFHRELVADDGTPLELGFVRCRGDQISLKLSLPRRLPGADE